MTKQLAQSPRPVRMSQKLRAAIEARETEGLTVAAACEKAGLSQAGYFAAMKRPRVCLMPPVQRQASFHASAASLPRASYPTVARPGTQQTPSRYWQGAAGLAASLWQQGTGESDVPARPSYVLPVSSKAANPLRMNGAGFRGSVRVVGEWATRQRRAERALPIGIGKSPPARRIVRLLTIGRDHLSKADAVLVAQSEAALPALAQARLLADRFTRMVRNSGADQFEPWLENAEPRLLSAFARGLRKDQAAVAAALVLLWSNGQTEGQINRLKLLKRQMYGRAGIALLKARIAATA